MLIMPLTERDERFAAGSELYLVRKREEERDAGEDRIKPDDRIGVRSSGWRASARSEEAKPLFGASLFIRATELDEPEEGSYYAFQIEGCEVYEGERLVGTVTRLVRIAEGQSLHRDRAGGRGEKLLFIPFIKAGDPVGRRGEPAHRHRRGFRR